LAILATFMVRGISDNSFSTWPYCLAIVANILNIYTILVSASNIEMRILPQPYTLP
jgi:hypothetical protein